MSTAWVHRVVHMLQQVVHGVIVEVWNLCQKSKPHHRAHYANDPVTHGARATDRPRTCFVHICI